MEGCYGEGHSIGGCECDCWISNQHMRLNCASSGPSRSVKLKKEEEEEKKNIPHKEIYIINIYLIFDYDLKIWDKYLLELNNSITPKIR